jgi:hypothetical protein
MGKLVLHKIILRNMIDRVWAAQELDEGHMPALYILSAMRK